MSSYPESLPGPSRLGHKPKPRNFMTDLEGPAAYLNRERDLSGKAEVEFFFTAEQAAVFYAWWRDELLYGGMSFNCSWPAIRSGPMVVQFLATQIFAFPNPSVNTWSHVAISRNSGIVAAFVNGVLVGAYADATNFSNPQPLLIGHDRDGPGRFTPFGGYIEDFRITNGVGRYRASFTPPARTFCDRV